MKSYLWDYDEKELKKTEKGRIFLLERKINYGFYLERSDKIKRSLLKSYWDKLNIEQNRKEYLHFLLWEK